MKKEQNPKLRIAEMKGIGSLSPSSMKTIRISKPKKKGMFSKREDY